LFHWDWRPEVVVVLAFLGITYTLGWWRLRRSGHRGLANGWRLAAYLSGLLVVGLALLSAIDALQSLLFTMHMVQHELLMMVAPPLLLLANPLPFVLWGLPVGLRREVGRLLAPEAPLRRTLRRLTTPWLVWALYVATLWLWHYPVAYEAALRYEWIHDLEHLSFFLTALLFWWHVTAAAPRVHGALSYGMRMGYVLLALVQNEILAVSIALARQPLYTYYETVPRLWGLSVLEDQMLGGAIMWIPGGMMYALTAIILLARLLDQEEQQTSRQARNPLHSLEHGV
jgi:cytochrome c oxidase assembly factor CtaG